MNSRTFLSLNQSSIKANVRSLMSNTVEVNQVNLDDVAVVIEQKGMTSNLNDILKSMPKKPKTDNEEKKGPKREKRSHCLCGHKKHRCNREAFAYTRKTWHGAFESLRITSFGYRR